MNIASRTMLQEFELYKGQLVISQMGQVMRLVGLGEDDDYFYLLWNGKKVYWNCGHIIPLKGFIEDIWYNYQNNQEYINDHAQDSEFMQRYDNWEDRMKNIRAEAEIMNGYKEKAMVSFCWEIN